MNTTMNHTNTQRGWYRGVFRDEGGGAKVAAALPLPNQFFRGSPNQTIKKTIKREKEEGGGS